MKSKKFMNSINNIDSQYLFNKNYNELSFNELGILTQYQYDKKYPLWKKIKINNINLKYDYEISNIGIIRFLNSNNQYEYIKEHIDRYKYVYLVHQGKIIVKHIHRLVAESFIPNDGPINKTQVNHINGNKQCNWVGNLEWVTPKENKWHAINTGLDHPSHGHQLHGIKNGTCTHTEEQVRKACELLQKGQLTYAKIGKLIGANADFVRSLTRGVWREITKEYNIPQSQNILSQNIKTKIRKLVKEKNSIEEIKNSFKHYIDIGTKYDSYIIEQQQKLLK